jgi:hypothetical protein
MGGNAMEITLDYEVVGLITTYTAALVAGIRAQTPKIDGPWVILLTLVCGFISAIMLTAAWLPTEVRYGLLAVTGAIGGVSLLDRTIARLKTQTAPPPTDSTRG